MTSELPLELPLAAARRNADFHSIFPSLKDELLIEDFSCAILRDILIQGRLYLSENHLAFSARLLSWTFDVLIPLNSITAIDKRFVAGFIPNSIEISTETKKYFFASFLQRDYAYDVLKKAWNGPPSLKELESELEISKIKDSLKEGDSNAQPIHHSSSNMIEKEFTETAASLTPCPMATGHSGTQFIVDEIISLSPDKIWNLLFADDAIHEPAGWLRNYHTLRQRSDFKFSHWPLFNDYPPVGSVRSFSYVVPVNGGVFFQGKTTPCFGNECILDMVIDGEDLNSFCVLTEAKTPQVPYGDTFLTKTHVCVFPFEGKWKIRVSVQADFKKPPWTRIIIEKAIIDGMTEFYGPLVKQLTSIQDTQKVDVTEKPAEILISDRPSRFTERDIQLFLKLNLILFTFACIFLVANLYFMLQIRGVVKTEL